MAGGIFLVDGSGAVLVAAGAVSVVGRTILIEMAKLCLQLLDLFL